ncbi:MAG: DUF2027 domain-containing protein [Candidatus Aphodosoma sp.]
MANNIKTGDRVRYLNAVGGGIVRGFQGKNIVLVEEEDGFETPVLVNEVVVVKPTNQYNFPVDEHIEKNDGAPTGKTVKQQEEEPEPKTVIPEYSWNERDETPDGERLSAYLAFVPADIKQLQTTDMELYAINDSNYYIHFALYSVNKHATLRYSDTIEPQTKLLLGNINKLQLNEIADLRFQAFAYKKIAFAPKPAIDVPIHINPVKFYKLHSFTENDYFDAQAFIVNIIKNDILDLGIQIDPASIQKAICSKSEPEPKRQQPKPKRQHNEPLEIDLHINELVDTTAGMSRADILQLQLSTFERVMNENIRYKGRKIIFIHGKGEGVLRAEIEKRLKRKYPECQFYDASFQQYGFGATQVVIH